MAALANKNQQHLEQLVNDFRRGGTALIITGAGLSVASGIAPYRNSRNAIWEKFVVEWGTRKKFLRNPAGWWNKFWLRTHQIPEYYKASPNAGHLAIADMCKKVHAHVVTQNIDTLHSRTPLDPSKLVEVHGRLNLYKCVTKGCPYAFEKSITSEQIEINKFAINGTGFWEGNLEVSPPPCPHCKAPVLPQALLFDEDYTSHTFYQWDRVLEWLRLADIYIFVGTSFSVGITQQALYMGQALEKRMYNFNVFKEAAADYQELYHIIGPAEKTLPALNRMLLVPSGPEKPRLFYNHRTDLYEEEVDDSALDFYDEFLTPNERKEMELFELHGIFGLSASGATIGAASHEETAS